MGRDRTTDERIDIEEPVAGIPRVAGIHRVRDGVMQEELRSDTHHHDREWRLLCLRSEETAPNVRCEYARYGGTKRIIADQSDLI